MNISIDGLSWSDLQRKFNEIKRISLVAINSNAAYFNTLLAKRYLPIHGNIKAELVDY